MVARVGDVVVTAEAVRAIMDAQHVDARTACDRAVRDALFARAGLEQRVDANVGRDLDAVRARALAEKSHVAALAQGPVKPEELQPFVDRDYYDVARPPTWLTVHALVQAAQDGSDEDLKRAEEVANAIHAAVLPAGESIRGTPGPTIEDLIVRNAIVYGEPAYKAFSAAAKGVDARGFTVRVEALAPLAADGGTVLPPPSPRSGYDPAFVVAATGLEQRGDVSKPTRGANGWHVILLMGRTPARMLPEADLVELFRVEVIAARSKALLNKELEPLRAASGATLDRNIEAMLSLVTFDAARVGGAPPQADQAMADPRGAEPR